uniref:Uncharacterized protein n=1 Tax=Eutreptiella gymnastica TaxID=73025 RepID=A0A7S1ISV3_9EUGL
MASASLHTPSVPGDYGALESSTVQAAPIKHPSAASGPTDLGLRFAWPSVPGTAVCLLAVAAAGAAAVARALWQLTGCHRSPAINLEYNMRASDPEVALLGYSGHKTATSYSGPHDEPPTPLSRRAVLALPFAATPMLCPSRATAFLPTFPDTPLRSSIDVAAEARFMIKQRDGRSTLTPAEEEVLRAPVTQRTLLRYGNNKVLLRDSMIAAADAARAAEQAQLEAVTRGAPQRGTP